jgi:hypothetical protein
MARRLREEGALRGELLHALMTAEGADSAAAASRVVLRAKDALFEASPGHEAVQAEGQEALLALNVLRFSSGAAATAEEERSAIADKLADDLERCSPFAAAFLRELQR